MSFYATFDAMITVPKSVGKDALIQKIKDAFDIPEVWTDDKAENSFDLWFGEYAKYNEDSIYTFLAEIEPYTISGEITYTGEDSSNWRHVFDSHFSKNLPSRTANCFPMTPLNRKGRCRHEQRDH